jgi:F420H(2)-dependent quinone reductase
VLLYRATRGVIGHRAPFGPSMLLLDTVGARTGRRRTAPLLYVRDGEDYVIVGSNGGSRRHPAWVHNLRAHPETTIQVGSSTFPVTSREATPAERDRLWARAGAAWPGYDGYARRARREIPLVVLSPQR